MAVIPDDGSQPLVLRHVSTPQRAAEMLREVCGAQVRAGRPACLGWSSNRGRCQPGLPRALHTAQVHPPPCGVNAAPQVDADLLKATELRLAGNAAARGGDLKKALALYTVGLELEVRRFLESGGCCLAAGAAGTVHTPPVRLELEARPGGQVGRWVGGWVGWLVDVLACTRGGCRCQRFVCCPLPHPHPPALRARRQVPACSHLLLSNRSGVRLELGDAAGALEDANAAAECAPAGFTTAAIRCGAGAAGSAPLT